VVTAAAGHLELGKLANHLARWAHQPHQP
jgi:hypothetical protein